MYMYGPHEVEPSARRWDAGCTEDGRVYFQTRGVRVSGGRSLECSKAWRILGRGVCGGCEDRWESDVGGVGDWGEWECEDGGEAMCEVQGRVDKVLRRVYVVNRRGSSVLGGWVVEGLRLSAPFTLVLRLGLWEFVCVRSVRNLFISFFVLRFLTGLPDGDEPLLVSRIID